MEQEPDEHFRALFWQKLAPLAGLPVFGLLLVRAPITDGWSPTAWSMVGGLAGMAVAAYLALAWHRAKIILNREGLRLYIAGRVVTWPYEDLLKVKQVGRFRVRMCFNTGQNDGYHTHVTIDVSNSDAFTDALLDRYALTQGEELADDHEAEALAA